MRFHSFLTRSNIWDRFDREYCISWNINNKWIMSRTNSHFPVDMSSVGQYWESSQCFKFACFLAKEVESIRNKVERWIATDFYTIVYNPYIHWFAWASCSPLLRSLCIITSSVIWLLCCIRTYYYDGKHLKYAMKKNVGS